jgi:uncharacterized membrane protein YcjF (UPF0283 family)
MAEPTPMTRLDIAGPSHDNDGEILSPAQERLLEQVTDTMREAVSAPGPVLLASQQDKPAAVVASPPATPAQAAEPQRPSDPEQPLGPYQEKLIRGALPATTTGVLVRKPPLADEDAALARASVGALNRFFRSLHWATILALSILLLLTVVLLAILVNQVLLFPAWLQPVGYVALAVALAVAGWVLYGLCRRFARLATTPRFWLGVQSHLDQANTIRSLQHDNHFSQVRDQLVPLVRDYELTPQRRALLLRCGATHLQLDNLVWGRGRLLDKVADDPPPTWVIRCYDEFYTILNDIGRTCCHRAMKRLFVMTAAAPQGLIDSLLVLFATLKHLDDLCQIYNVKTQGGDSLRLLLWVVGHMALAQPLEDMTDATGDQLTSALGDWLSTGSDAAAGIIANGLGVFVGKVSNGAVHALLLGRISAAARGYLLPLLVKRK